MPANALSYPVINGLYYDFSSVEISVPGYNGAPPYQGIVAIQSIDYDDNLTPGELYGAAPQVLARTRGKYKASGKMKLPKVEATNMIQVMSEAGQGLIKPQGYLEYGALVVTVTYYEPSLAQNGFSGMISDTLVGLRFSKNADAHKTGQDPLMVDMDFTLMMLIRNGQAPFTPDVLAQIYPGVTFPTP